MNLKRVSTQNRQSGSAVLVVLTLLAVMGVLIICNNRILYSLKQDLRFVAEKQQLKFAPAAFPTNAPKASRPAPAPAP